MTKILLFAVSLGAVGWVTANAPLVMLLILLALSLWLYMTGQAFQWLVRSGHHAPCVHLASVARPGRSPGAYALHAKSRGAQRWGRRPQHA